MMVLAFVEDIQGEVDGFELNIDLECLGVVIRDGFIEGVRKKNNV
jgi:hypothetical protein